MTSTVVSLFNKNKIVIIAALISIFFSLLAYSTQDPINYDGILYLATADAYLKAGFKAAIHLYPWPFYSMLIAWLSKLSSLTLQHSAQLLNTVFLTIIVSSFVKLIEKINSANTNILSNSKQLLIIAAIIILAFPTLNHYRDLIVRDFGYWAFLLLSLNQLLNYGKNPRWLYVITWLLCISIATLFRIEGAIIFALAPLSLLFYFEYTFLQRITLIIKLLAPPILIIIIYFIWQQFTTQHTTLNLGRLYDLKYYLLQSWQNIFSNFQTKITIINQSLIDQTTAADTGESWFLFGFSGLFLQLVISTLTILYSLLFVYAVYKRLVPASNTANIVIFFTFLNFLIAFIFYAQHLFLSGRYLIAGCLILLVWATFSLQHLFELWKNKRRWLFSLVSIVLFLTAIGGLFSFGYSKTYITQAGLWLKQNTPAQASVYSNNKQVLFYAERTPIDFQKIYDDSTPLKNLQETRWQNYNYLAIRINRNIAEQEPKINNLLGQQPIKIFSNKRGDKILIFLIKTSKTNDNSNSRETISRGGA